MFRNVDPAEIAEQGAASRDSPQVARAKRNGQVDRGDDVSVVVTTYYRNDRLREALESVRTQEYEPIETLVVDGSEDRHAEPVVEEYPGCTYLSQSEHQLVNLEGVRAVAAARDLGVAHASGRYVHFLDDDDRLRPDAIAKQVELLSNTDEVGMVYCGIQVEDGPRRMPDPRVRGDILEHALRLQVAPCVPSTMLVSRELLDDIPPMGSLPHDDASLMVEFALRTEVDFVDEPLVIRGDPDSSLQSSPSSLAGRKATIEEYDHLYERFDPEVRRTALARVYLQEGVLTVSRRVWSPKAIRAFAFANYYTSKPNAPFVAAFVASLFGRPGWTLGVRLYRMTSGNEQRGGIGNV